MPPNVRRKRSGDGKSKGVPLERNESKALSHWLDVRRVLHCHVPNEGKRSQAGGALLKQIGLKRGVPDHLIFDKPPAGDGVGAAIEMKRRGGRGHLTKDQAAWLAALQVRGWHCLVARGAAEAVEWLTELGYDTLKSNGGE